jgi:phage baseplate assembly protein W
MSDVLRREVSGISLPFRLEAGGVATARGVEKIRENLAHILLTDVGSRVMRRGYGAGLRQLLHEPNNEALRALAHQRVAAAIQEHEPRVLLQGVSTEQRDATLFIRIDYVVRRTRQPESLTLPLDLAGAPP